MNKTENARECLEVKVENKDQHRVLPMQSSSFRIKNENGNDVHNNELIGRNMVENESESNETHDGQSHFNDDLTTNSHEPIKTGDPMFGQTSSFRIKVDGELNTTDLHERTKTLPSETREQEPIKIEDENVSPMFGEVTSFRIKSDEESQTTELHQEALLPLTETGEANQTQQDQIKIEGESESPMFDGTTSFRIKSDEEPYTVEKATTPSTDTSGETRQNQQEPSDENGINYLDEHETIISTTEETREHEPIKIDIEIEYPMFDGTKSFRIKIDEAEGINELVVKRTTTPTETEGCGLDDKMGETGEDQHNEADNEDEHSDDNDGFIENVSSTTATITYNEDIEMENVSGNIVQQIDSNLRLKSICYKCALIFVSVVIS